MPLTREHAHVALDSVSHLLSRPNIHTIDVLPKTVREEQTDDLAIVVTVTKKKHGHQLDDDDYPIPKAIEVAVVGADGRLTTELVPTDVVEGPAFRRAALDQKVRPTVGGYMVAVWANWFSGKGGTLGVNMQYQNHLSIVTNNHVIANNGNIGSTVYQPDRELLSDNAVATVSGFMPVTSYANPAQPNPVRNIYDFAWANITQADTAALNIKDIGQPTGTRAPVVGEHVRWIGKSTGTVQYASIVSITTNMNIPGDQGRWEWWQNLIDLSGISPGHPAAQMRSGDSGSMLIAEADMNIVGLATFGDANLVARGTRFHPY